MLENIITGQELKIQKNVWEKSFEQILSTGFRSVKNTKRQERAKYYFYHSSNGSLQHEVRINLKNVSAANGPVKQVSSFTHNLMLTLTCLIDRCTTCGEYIYKGRKFNSRKEDVDDMNHLGLRIYRFYIKVRLFQTFHCYITNQIITQWCF